MAYSSTHSLIGLLHRTPARSNRILSQSVSVFLSILVCLLSSHLVLSSAIDDNRDVLNITTISSSKIEPTTLSPDSIEDRIITSNAAVTLSSIKSIKDDDNYRDDATVVTTVPPDKDSTDNNDESKEPSTVVQHDKHKDRLGDESKGNSETRKAEDNEDGSDEGEETITAASESVNIDQSKSATVNSRQGKSMKHHDDSNEDEDEEEDQHEHNGTANSDNNTDTNNNKKSDSEDDNDHRDEEEEVATKPRVVKLDRRPSHNSREEEEHDNETEEGDNEDDEDDYEDADKLASNVCTAEYFLDKIIPEDYPTEISKDVKHINETIERLNRMYNFSNQMMQKLNPFIRELASRATDFLYESQIDAQCMGSLFRIIKAVNERKPWALSFLDATGPLLTGGYRQGKFVSLGEFDQCLETMSELPEEMVNNEPIRGQYCLVKPIIPMPPEYKYKQGEPVAKSKIDQVNRFLNDEYIETYLGLYKFLKNTILRVGMCLPDKCDPADVENAMNRFLVRKTGLSVEVGPHCVKATDQTKLDNYQSVALFIFGVLILLIIACSLYEIVYRILLDSGRFFPTNPQASLISTPYSFTSSQHQHPLKFMRQVSTTSTTYTKRPLQIQVFTMFSIIRNTRVLFEIPAYRKLPLDTLRLLLIIFFFISNAYMYTIVFAPMVVKRFYVLGPMQLASEKKYFFLRMYYMLDCFLAFSGISVALAFKSQTFSYLKYIVQNYLRYVVPILFSIGLIYIVPLMGSGPLWHLFDQTITHSCKQNLWPTLLFYNNINENVEEICNLPTTFVSLVFQMQIIAPIFLIVASRFQPKSGSLFLIIMFCISCISNLIPRFFFGYKLPYEYHAMKSFTEIKTSVMFYNFHPIVHISPFLFGLIVGHLITSRPVKQYTYTMTVGVTSFVFFILGFIYMENLDIKSPNLSTMEIISMLTFGRVPMLTFFCWIIYASLSGCMTIVKRFLSSVVWRPLAQLSYGFYITSAIVTAYRLFSIRQTTTLSAENMFRTIVSDAVVSFFLAYLIHIMVQQPMRNLRQILMNWRQLFDVKSTSSSLGKYQPNIVFQESANGKFTQVCDEIISPSKENGHTKESIVLNFNEGDNADMKTIQDSINNNHVNNNNNDI